MRKSDKQFTLMRVSLDHLEFLGSLCTEKGMSYDTALDRVIQAAVKNNRQNQKELVLV